MPAVRIPDFDVWQPGYGLATVKVLRANTTILANIYEDEALTLALANPITLLEKTVNGISYGKFAKPIYTGQAYELQINSVDSTGVNRPALTSLDAENASKATVTVAGGSVAVELEDHLARFIDVRDYGAFLAVGAVGASDATNTASIAAAIGAATAQGGGIVGLPAGTYEIEQLTIPLNVILRGEGIGVTILQCTQAGTVVTLGGSRAGLSRLTLDGVSKVATSIGVYSLGRDRVSLDAVEIKRFETGFYARGGEQARFQNAIVSDCSYGARLHGDNDTANGGAGTTMQLARWDGGRVEFCSLAGIELKNVDLPCIDTVLTGIGFVLNTGTALRIEGARSTLVRSCWWQDNTVNLDVVDGSPVNVSNTVIGLHVSDGRIVNGEVKLKDTLESVKFARLDLEGATVTLTTPKANVIAEDCRETDVTLAGSATAWLRASTQNRGAAAGFTTGNAATKAWSIALAPGERVYLEAKVIGRARTSTDDAFYHIAVSAKRPGAALAYDSQTGQFTVGNIVTGQTSGASGRIVADADGGTTGTLTLQDVIGAFVDNEIITDGATGSATANGALVLSNAALVGSVTALRAAQETVVGWDATFVANGPEIELQVTGAAATTVEWVCDVEVTA